MLYATHFIAFIILNTFLITYCYDNNKINLTQSDQEIEEELYELFNDLSDNDDFNLPQYEYVEPEYDVSQYILYFKSYHSVWNNHDEWIWNSSHNDNTSINSTIAC